MKLEVIRYSSQKDSTLGMLFDVTKGRKFLCFTLEDEARRTKIKGETRIPAGTYKLKLRKDKPLKWIKYGSLMINWSDWTYFDGNYIAQSKTKKNKTFYLALSCKKRVLNNTLNNSYWTSWYFPETDFEFKLINDFCDQDFNF